MLALIGYIGAIPGRVWAVARQNPALKWALLALGVVLAVEVVAELGLKVWRDYSEAAKADYSRRVQKLQTDVSTMQTTPEQIRRDICNDPDLRRRFGKQEKCDE